MEFGLLFGIIGLIVAYINCKEKAAEHHRQAEYLHEVSLKNRRELARTGTIFDEYGNNLGTKWDRPEAVQHMRDFYKEYVKTAWTPEEWEKRKKTYGEFANYEEYGIK